MAANEFVVLYTHQKRKKAKVWQDGVLKMSEQGTKATLYGEGNKRLDLVHIKQTQVSVGEELESEKYLITIEDVKQASEMPSETTPSAVSQENVNQVTREPYLSQPQAVRRLPLKRRRTGFVPPRPAEKRPSQTNDNLPTSNVTQESHTKSVFGSPRQASSLFSTPWGSKDSSKLQNAGILSMYGSEDQGRGPSGDFPSATSSAFQQHSLDPSSNFSTTVQHSSDPSSSLSANLQHSRSSSQTMFQHSTPCGSTSSTPMGLSDERLSGDSQSSYQVENSDHYVPGLQHDDNGFELGQRGSHSGQTFALVESHGQNGNGQSLSIPPGLVGLNPISERTSYIDRDGSIKCDAMTTFATSCEQPDKNSDEGNKPGVPPNTMSVSLDPSAGGGGGVSKRSASQILALLGKGRKAFQPPLKQKPAHQEYPSPQSAVSADNQHRHQSNLSASGVNSVNERKDGFQQGHFMEEFGLNSSFPQSEELVCRTQVYQEAEEPYQSTGNVQSLDKKEDVRQIISQESRSEHGMRDLSHDGGDVGISSQTSVNTTRHIRGSSEELRPEKENTVLTPLSDSQSPGESPKMKAITATVCDDTAKEKAIQAAEEEVLRRNIVGLVNQVTETTCNSVPPCSSQAPVGEAHRNKERIDCTSVSDASSCEDVNREKSTTSVDERAVPDLKQSKEIDDMSPSAEQRKVNGNDADNTDRVKMDDPSGKIVGRTGIDKNTESKAEMKCEGVMRTPPSMSDLGSNPEGPKLAAEFSPLLPCTAEVEEQFVENINLTAMELSSVILDEAQASKDEKVDCGLERRSQEVTETKLPSSQYGLQKDFDGLMLVGDQAVCEAHTSSAVHGDNDFVSSTSLYETGRCNQISRPSSPSYLPEVTFDIGLDFDSQNMGTCPSVLSEQSCELKADILQEEKVGLSVQENCCEDPLSSELTSVTQTSKLKWCNPSVDQSSEKDSHQGILEDPRESEQKTGHLFVKTLSDGNDREQHIDNADQCGNLQLFPHIEGKENLEAEATVSCRSVIITNNDVNTTLKHRNQTCNIPNQDKSNEMKTTPGEGAEELCVLEKKRNRLVDGYDCKSANISKLSETIDVRHHKAQNFDVLEEPAGIEKKEQTSYCEQSAMVPQEPLPLSSDFHLHVAESQHSSNASVDTLDFSEDILLSQILGQQKSEIEKGNKLDNDLQLEDASQCISFSAEEDAVVPDIVSARHHLLLEQEYLLESFKDHHLVDKQQGTCDASSAGHPESEQSVPVLRDPLVFGNAHQQVGSCMDELNAVQPSKETNRYTYLQALTVLHKHKISQPEGNVENNMTDFGNSSEDFADCSDIPDTSPVSQHSYVCNIDNRGNSTKVIEECPGISDSNGMWVTSKCDDSEALSAGRTFSIQNANANSRRLEGHSLSPASVLDQGHMDLSRFSTPSPMRPEAVFGQNGVVRNPSTETPRGRDSARQCTSTLQLPHPSDLKTPSRKKAGSMNVQSPTLKHEEPEKGGIYWTQFKSSGRVRRNQTPNFYTGEMGFGAPHGHARRNTNQMTPNEMGYRLPVLHQGEISHGQIQGYDRRYHPLLQNMTHPASPFVSSSIHSQELGLKIPFLCQDYQSSVDIHQDFEPPQSSPPTFAPFLISNRKGHQAFDMEGRDQSNSLQFVSRTPCHEFSGSLHNTTGVSNRGVPDNQCSYTPAYCADDRNMTLQTPGADVMSLYSSGRQEECLVDYLQETGGADGQFPINQNAVTHKQDHYDIPEHSVFDEECKDNLMSPLVQLEDQRENMDTRSTHSDAFDISLDKAVQRENISDEGLLEKVSILDATIQSQCISTLHDVPRHPSKPQCMGNTSVTASQCCSLFSSRPDQQTFKQRPEMQNSKPRKKVGLSVTKDQHMNSDHHTQSQVCGISSAIHCNQDIQMHGTSFQEKSRTANIEVQCPSEEVSMKDTSSDAQRVNCVTSITERACTPVLFSTQVEEKDSDDLEEIEDAACLDLLESFMMKSNTNAHVSSVKSVDQPSDPSNDYTLPRNTEQMSSQNQKQRSKANDRNTKLVRKQVEKCKKRPLVARPPAEQTPLPSIFSQSSVKETKRSKENGTTMRQSLSKQTKHHSQCLQQGDSSDVNKGQDTISTSALIKPDSCEVKMKPSKRISSPSLMLDAISFSDEEFWEDCEELDVLLQSSEQTKKLTPPLQERKVKTTRGERQTCASKLESSVSSDNEFWADVDQTDFPSHLEQRDMLTPAPMEGKENVKRDKRNATSTMSTKLDAASFNDDELWGDCEQLDVYLQSRDQKDTSFPVTQDQIDRPLIENKSLKLATNNSSSVICIVESRSSKHKTDGRSSSELPSREFKMSKSSLPQASDSASHLSQGPSQHCLGLGQSSQGIHRGLGNRRPVQPLHTSNNCNQPPRMPYPSRQIGVRSQLHGVSASGVSVTQADSAPSKGFRTPILKELQGSLNVGASGELSFPAAESVQSEAVPQRKVMIPVSFSSVNSYKQVLMAAVKEHLCILLFELSSRYHSAMAKADVSMYTRSHDMRGHPGQSPHGGGSAGDLGGNPLCKHNQPARMVCVKKEGPNKGRMFYVCQNPRESQCKFFLWADQHNPDSNQPSQPSQATQGRQKIPLTSADSIEKFARSQNIHLYCESMLSRRGSLNEGVLQGIPTWVKKYRAQQATSTFKKLYLKLQRKEHSSKYAKDDVWIVSKDLTFDPASSFVAKSMFHGPSSSSEIEIEPLAGYSPSNWPSNGVVYGILACNASSELTCLDNIQEYLNPRTFPILPHLINSVPSENERSQSLHRPAANSSFLNLPPAVIIEMVEETIDTYHLNPDQAAALQRVAGMLVHEEGNADSHPPVTLIHGVFGAGKSYLLAVTVLLLVRLFSLGEEGDQGTGDGGWKVLIASTTNVAVDRILLGLLDLGFEEFIRVGSIRKIAKPVLPYSVHASDKENQEMKELQEMLKGELTLAERQHVKRSIERQRLGKNKDLMSKVKVIGVTCAACTFPCIKNLTFPVMMLDECSQMTEASSLLPLARFGCQKLVLVGDPHQLDPTIQGSEAAHKSGLEQTMFDRLTLMGYEPIMLRTQYRCHPSISALANSLFYDNQLLDGIIEEDRRPLVPGLPTLCFFNVPHGREASAPDGSYYNSPEASFVVFMITALLRLGVAPSELGVITLYKAQVSKIHMMLQNSSDRTMSESRAVQISTVDAFQGGEKSIIILSCVRTEHVGFIDSDKRTNVALTRSKNHLLIVGGMRMLSDNPLWGEVIHRCQERPDGIKDSRTFQKQWEERLAEIEQEQEEEDREKDRQRQTGGRRKKRKVERHDIQDPPPMSIDSQDDDFVSSSHAVCSPIPFDAHTPVTPASPIKQMEQSSYVSKDMQSGTFYFPAEGDVAPQRESPSTSKDANVVRAVTPTKHSDDRSCMDVDCTIPEEGSIASTQKRSDEEGIAASFSYSPLKEVVESDSGDSEELPTFDFGNVLEV